MIRVAVEAAHATEEQMVALERGLARLHQADPAVEVGGWGGRGGSPAAMRARGTVAQVAQSHSRTMGQWHSGTVAQWHSGTVARRS